MAESDLSPGIAVWETTLKCNLKCLHCGSSAGEEKSDELTHSEGVKLIRDLAEIGFKGIALMGGEIFLRKDWHELSKEIKNLDVSLSIVSNGFCNANKIVPMLSKLETDCVTVGLDGLEKTHDQIRGVAGSFQKAVEFLKACKKANIPTSAITTAHKINLREIPKMTNLVLEEIGVDWNLQEAVPIGRFKNELSLSAEEYYKFGEFIASLHKKYPKERVVGGHNFGFYSCKIPNLSLYPEWKGCYAGISVLGVKHNGNIIGCLTLPDEFIEGNIRNQSVIEIWNDPEAFSYNRKFKRGDSGHLCKNCIHGNKCMGGCMSRSASVTGKPHNDPHCFYRIEKNGKIC